MWQIFLDEPTTGMDPLSKRRVWSMIQRAKQSRIVLLTTHSMEEADALGDKIAVMHHGRLRAVGTSLFLKNKFGKGHTVSILSETENTPKIKEIVMRCMPTAEIIASTAGNTSISLPRGAVSKIPKLFSELTAQPELVKEWGLSNTTLEEVFLRLAAQDHDVNTAIQEEPNNFSRVTVMRKPAAGSDVGGPAESSAVVVVLEGPNADLLRVVTPEEYMLKVMSDEEDEDETAPLLESYENDEEAASSDGDAQEPNAGQLLQFDNPLKPVAAATVSRSGGTGMGEQVIAVVWKDLNLAFGCRKKGGGCTACFTFKCCELGCYIVIFFIFGLGAVLNSFVENFGDPEFGAVYCPNGVLNQTGPADAASGWADKSTWTCPLEGDAGSEYHETCYGATVHGRTMRWSSGNERNDRGDNYAPGEWLRNNDWQCADDDRVSTNLCAPDELGQMMVDWASPLASQSDSQLQSCLQECEQSNNGCQDCSTCMGCWPCCRDCRADCEQTPEQSSQQCRQNLRVCGTWNSCFEQMGPWISNVWDGLDPTLEIWTSTKDSQENTDLADTRVFLNRSNWNRSPKRRLRQFDSAEDIDAAVRSAQHLLRSSQIGLHLVNRDDLHLEDAAQGQVHDPDTCPWATYSPNDRGSSSCFEGRTLDDTQTAIRWWERSFPALALEIDKATIPVVDHGISDDVESLSLHYNVRLWSQSEGQSFRYTDVSAALWSEGGTCSGCNQVGPHLYRPNWPLYGNGETAKDVRRAINAVSNIVLRSMHPVLEDCRCDCTCDCGCEHCTSDRCERPPTETDYLERTGVICSGNETTCGDGQPDNTCFFDYGDRCDQPWNNCQPDCVDCGAFSQGDPDSCPTESGCVYVPAGTCSVGWLDCGFTSGDNTTCREGCIYTPAWEDDGFDREHDCEFRLDTTFVPMPALKFTRSEVEEVPNFWLIMMPMLTMQLIPSLASLLAMEKEEGLLEMVKTEGGTLGNYLLGNYLFCLVYS